MNKTQINAVLKTLGYGNLRYSNGKTYRRGNSMVKGFHLISTGACMVTSPETQKFSDLVNELKQHFELQSYYDNCMAIFVTGKLKIVVCLTNFNTYGGLNPDYKTWFASVNIEKL
ncbi:hypothetical protein KNT81_gp086 [Proteus phage phiP4-3]|uniref:Uncharacterized protein n=1 Tax=Proteus phage phiP4-3 TaxID=2065203 RepID=A0A2I6PFE8_9CAUD|nr:hypothetical protein KNT81_gp086 [Proteus phage phiP4-3]AUM58444.1 hypothetical protein phiP43_086 [Proteus phage phiP4-3]AZV01311.1 hypothetical protein vBSdyM006_174 [Shigella phage vB_SdyM_006]